MDTQSPFGKKPTKNGDRYVLVVVDLLTRVGEIKWYLFPTNQPIV